MRRENILLDVSLISRLPTIYTLVVTRLYILVFFSGKVNTKYSMYIYY